MLRTLCCVFGFVCLALGVLNFLALAAFGGDMWNALSGSLCVLSGAFSLTVWATT